MDVIVAEATDNPKAHPLVPWWSFSKTVLAAAVLTLVERRRLDIDAPVAATDYTVRHLLQHTSGLPDYGGLADYHRAVAAGEPPWSVEELLRRTNGDKLLFKPGSRFSYSNIGYMFVRQIIERTAGVELNEALRTLVFRPLGIDGVFVAEAVKDFDMIVWGNTQQYDPGWVYHGCVVGSLSCAATWLHRLMQDDLLTPATRRAMLASRSYDPENDAPADSRYGLGLMIEPAPPNERLVGHAGAGPGSTITVFSALGRKRTFAASVGMDAPGTFPKLLDYVRTLI